MGSCDIARAVSRPGQTARRGQRMGNAPSTISRKSLTSLQARICTTRAEKGDQPQPAATPGAYS